MPRVTLLTDFGTADGYVAAMKGVIASAVPHVIIDDAAHDIPPGDIRAAAWALEGYWNRYPAGTVHIAVIDPGVGTARRALAGEVDGRFLVGPDNGVFSRVLRTGAAARTVDIERIDAAAVSSTFHGRDIFAPIAAHLLLGAALESLGPTQSDPVLLPEQLPVRAGRLLRGVVVHVDRFGNLITNIPSSAVPPDAAVLAAGRPARLVKTYGEGGPGELLALIGSRDLLEIAVRDGSAAALLAGGRDVEVVVQTPGTVHAG